MVSVELDLVLFPVLLSMVVARASNDFDQLLLSNLLAPAVDGNRLWKAFLDAFIAVRELRC